MQCGGTRLQPLLLPTSPAAAFGELCCGVWRVEDGDPVSLALRWGRAQSLWQPQEHGGGLPCTRPCAPCLRNIQLMRREWLLSPCYSRGKGRHEQGSHLAKVKTLGKWQSQSLDPGSFSPKSRVSTALFKAPAQTVDVPTEFQLVIPPALRTWGS